MKKFLAIFAVAALVAFAAPAIAATNPFMDVPAGHWAYDAAAQLASRGIASGYPDGAYKGAQPATRYEMASVVARMLASVDMEKAGKQDAELLKRLVLEFRNELDALGVKAGGLDKRVAVFEDGIGGWKIRGIFRFDAKFGSNDYGENYYTQVGKDNEFNKDQFRLYLTKTIDENTYFYAQYRTGGDDAGGGDGRGDQQHMRWSHLYVDTKLPWDIGLRVGRFAVDFEDDYGFYADNDALFGDFRTDGFRLTKSFGMLNATAIIGRNTDYDDEWKKYTVEYGAHMAYILDLNFRPSEKFFIGATGCWMKEDSSAYDVDGDINTYAFYAGYSFTPNVALKGIYYFQDLDDDVAALVGDDTPNAWKVILDVKQEVLKFTSLWVEYSQQDNGFLSTSAHERYGIGGAGYDYAGRNMTAARLFGGAAGNMGTSRWWFAQAKRQWNDKCSMFVRYAQVDFDTRGLEDAKSWGLGAGYQYSPAIYFELAYDQVDHGDYNGTLKAASFGDYKFGDGKESVFRFRTTVSF